MKTEKFLHFSVLIGLIAGLSFCSEKKDNSKSTMLVGAAALGASRSSAGTGTGEVSTFAGPSQGTTYGGDTDGTGNAASFQSPNGITSDGTDLYVADQLNNKIRKISIATGAVSTFAGPAQGTSTSGDTDGTGNTARFANPAGITSDGTNLYVTDSGTNKIRKIVIATAAVSTMAGPAQGTSTSGDTDGTGNAARFSFPFGIIFDGTNLYVTDKGNNKIRKIAIANGAVSTLAGPVQGTSTSGDTDGTGSAARFNNPNGITSDGTNLYVTDSVTNKVRKIVIATAAVSTFAGPVQGTSTSGDTDGTGNAARFSNPNGITSDGTNLYIADYQNNKVRKIVIATAAVNTFAGPAQGTTTFGDTDGALTTARFGGPTGILKTGTNLYVTDSSTNKIRKISL